MKNNPDKVIMTVAEFLCGAQTSAWVEEKELEEEQEAKMKDARARRDEEWSLLANQVVGGETAIFPSRDVLSEGEGFDTGAGQCEERTRPSDDTGLS